MEDKKQGLLDVEASNGLNSVASKTLPDSRKVRRENIRKISQQITYVKKEQEATQEAFDRNFPGELNNYTDEERWELLDEENKTRRAQFYKRLFQVELYVTAMVEYVSSGGMVDILKDMGMTYDLSVLKNNLNQVPTEEDLAFAEELIES